MMCEMEIAIGVILSAECPLFHVLLYNIKMNVDGEITPLKQQQQINNQNTDEDKGKRERE
jgi:hypothetical protein